MFTWLTFLLLYTVVVPSVVLYSNEYSSVNSQSAIFTYPAFEQRALGMLVYFLLIIRM